MAAAWPLAVGGQERRLVFVGREAETGQYDRLVSLASDLARLPVTVLVASTKCLEDEREPLARSTFSALNLIVESV